MWCHFLGCATTLAIEHEAPVARYYERLASVQARGSQICYEILRDVFQEVQNSMAPRTLLKHWALKTFPNATDYWSFRKMVFKLIYFVHLYVLFESLLNINIFSSHYNWRYPVLRSTFFI